MSDFDHVVPPDELTKPKVAIVGFTDHRDQAFDLPQDEFELWGLNELHRYHDWEQFDRWYEIHPRKDLDTDEQHIEQMGDFDIPIYLHDHYDDIPASLPFPKAEIEDALDSTYFTSSIAWQVGHALMLGAEEIHIYGVDMAQDSEYAEQRPCLEYWLGRAEGMGVPWHVPQTSDLMKTFGQYGFWDQGSVFAQKLAEREEWLHNQDNDRLKVIRKLEKEYEQKRSNLVGQLNQMQGALMEIREWPENEARQKRIEELECHIEDTRETLQRLDDEYEQKHGALRDERNQIVGALQDVGYWQRSWAVNDVAPSSGLTPDRSEDPRTGIQATDSGPPDADELGVAPKNRITEAVE